MKKFIAGAASLMLCMGLHAQDFRINPSGYFENGGANVMVFSDVYPEGHQGGLTLVLNGDRRAANGDVRFEISQGQWQGLPKMRSRVVDEADNEIRVTLSYPDSAKHMAGFNPMIYPDFVFGYTIKVKGEKDYLVLTVDLDQPVPERLPASWALIWNWYLPLCWASRGLWTTGRESFPTRRWGPP